MMLGSMFPVANVPLTEPPVTIGNLALVRGVLPFMW
jgi:hypothetical protein